MAKNWNAKKSAAIRSAMLAAVSPRDVYDIVKLQTFLALRGDTVAANFVLDRVIGKAVPMDAVMEIENAAQLESAETAANVALQLHEMWHSVPDQPLAIGSDHEETQTRETSEAHETSKATEATEAGEKTEANSRKDAETEDGSEGQRAIA